MKLRASLILGTATAGLLVVTAGPAMAADTATTFELTGGGLALSAPATAPLTNAPAGTLTITGSLGEAAVTDSRGGTVAWTASAASTAFTGVLGSSSTAVSYTAGVVAETGTITVADGIATTLTATPASVVAPTTLSGNNTASWTSTLAVTMPAGALADDYSGTVTTSVL